VQQEDVYGGSVGGLPTAGSKPGGYVPPSLKNRGAGETVDSRKREENSLRVTNLSEDTREDDLRVICPIYHSKEMLAGTCDRKLESSCNTSVLADLLPLMRPWPIMKPHG